MELLKVTLMMVVIVVILSLFIVPGVLLLIGLNITGVLAGTRNTRKTCNNASKG